MFLMSWDKKIPSGEDTASGSGKEDWIFFLGEDSRNSTRFQEVLQKHLQQYNSYNATDTATT